MPRSIPSIPYALPQGRTPRPAMWADVPDAQWDDWRWQLANRINSYEEFARIIHLTDEEVAGLKAPNKFRVDITPYFASLIDPDDPDCPVRLQVVPRARELDGFESMMEDSLAEDAHSPVPGLVHRYPDRVLMLVTSQCASYCRYCTRSRVVGDPHAAFFNRANYLKQLDYLRATPQVRDVLLSGGDPLTLKPAVLDELLAGLRSIPHIEIIRIGSRVPVFMPQRITDEFVETLRKYHPLWMNIHVNHPKEITPELQRACAKLADAGVPIGNQSVLLAGVNDHPETIKKLCHDLVKMRVKPYYLYQCDLVEGSEQEIIKAAEAEPLLPELGPAPGVELLLTETDGSRVPIVMTGVEADGKRGADRRTGRSLSGQEARLCLAREPEKVTAR